MSTQEWFHGGMPKYFHQAPEVRDAAGGSQADLPSACLAHCPTLHIAKLGTTLHPLLVSPRRGVNPAEIDRFIRVVERNTKDPKAYRTGMVDRN